MSSRYGPWTKASENPIAATNHDIDISGPGHSYITLSPDSTEVFIVYHTHADAQKPSGDRVVNINRIRSDESGKLRIRLKSLHRSFDQWLFLTVEETNDKLISLFEEMYTGCRLARA